MPQRVVFLTLFIIFFFAVEGYAQFLPNRVGRRLAGTIVDHSSKRGTAAPFYSGALGQCRDLYVYLPPGYDPARQYPVLLWLHGILQDERSFAREGLHAFDDAMAQGKLPPTIIVIPDGTMSQRPSYLDPGTFFLNSNLGCFEDYVVRDVWSFVRARYPICPDRSAHAIGGFSGGGAAAYRIAFKYPEEFGVIFAIAAPLNLRWQDCHGRYFGEFDPDCWGWRTEIRNRDVIGRFYAGLVKVRLGPFIKPLYGTGAQALAAVAGENPVEMLDQYDVQPGQFRMYVACGGRDEFNFDAQSESFIYKARQRGLEVEYGFERRGKHDMAFARKALPWIIQWLAQ